MSGETVYCRDCGAEIAARAEICPECGIRQRPPEGSDDDGMSAGIAAVASFFIPGLGQVFNGEITKGLIIGPIFILTAITGIGLLIAIPLWIWAVYDAYTGAQPDEPPTTDERDRHSGSRVASINRAVLDALEWYADRSDAPAEVRAVKQRYQNVDQVADISQSDLDMLIEAIDAYQAVHPPNERLEEARDIFNSHRY